MKKIYLKSILLFSLMASLAPAYGAKFEMKEILTLKPGAKIKEGKDLSGKFKNVDYRILAKDKKVESVRLEFSRPVPTEKYLDPGTKGHCLSRPYEGHIPMNRLYFFTLENNRRYELTPNKKIKSILIQDLPGAKNNRTCTFKEALKMEPSLNKLKTVK